MESIDNTEFGLYMDILGARAKQDEKKKREAPPPPRDDGKPVVQLKRATIDGIPGL